MAKFSVTPIDIMMLLKGWAVGLRNLNFTDNFRGYEWEGDIEAGQEVRLTHGLGVIPTRFILTDMQGVGTIVRGDVKATTQFFYVKNIAASSTFRGKILVLP